MDAKQRLERSKLKGGVNGLEKSVAGGWRKAGLSWERETRFASSGFWPRV